MSAILHRTLSSTVTLIPNDILLTPSLSTEAIGLLCVLLAMEDESPFNEEELADFRGEDLSKIKSILQEIEEAGHLEQETHEDDSIYWNFSD